MTAVAVAVVSWNTRDLLQQCLDSLAADVESGLAEVWVIDNASADGSATMAQTEFGWARVIASEENLGFGRAVNEVAQRVESEWIVPANADISVEPGALSALIEAGTRHPEAAIFAPRLIGSDGTTQQSVHSFPGVRLSAALASGLPWLSTRLGEKLCIEGAWDPDRAREVDWAHGAFLLCRRPAFDTIGRFDPRQWMYAEDLDLAWRASRARWSVRYVPEARVGHAGAAATTQAFGDDLGARFMTSTFAWMVERRGLAITWLYASINLLGALVRWLAYSALSSFGSAHFSARRDAARRWLGLHRKGIASRSALLRRRDS